MSLRTFSWDELEITWCHQTPGPDQHGHDWTTALQRPRGCGMGSHHFHSKDAWHRWGRELDSWKMVENDGNMIKHGPFPSGPEACFFLVCGINSTVWDCTSPGQDAHTLWLCFFSWQKPICIKVCSNQLFLVRFAGVYMCDHVCHADKWCHQSFWEIGSKTGCLPTSILRLFEMTREYSDRKKCRNLSKSSPRRSRMFWTAG